MSALEKMYEVGVVNAIICSDSNTSMVSYRSARYKIISLGGGGGGVLS